MAKYDVKFSCGHTETKQLFGKEADRQSKIAYWEENGICSHCYAELQNAEKAKGMVETEMLYSEYKNKFSHCDTKSGSYNAKTKTIVVYVPVVEEVAVEEVAEVSETIEVAEVVEVEAVVEEIVTMLDENKSENAVKTARTAVQLGSVEFARRFERHKRVTPKLKEQATNIVLILQKYRL